MNPDTSGGYYWVGPILHEVEVAIPDIRPKPLVGGYYWFPTAEEGRLTWAVLTCHDLGGEPDVGHVDLWPAVIERLTAAWGRDAGGLRRPLTEHYTGLPRGRGTRPGKTVLVLHGDNAPVPDWRERLVKRYRLGGRTHRLLLDEHERMLSGDPERVEEALGFRYD